MSQNKPKWRVLLPREGKMGGVDVYDGDQYVCQMSHHPAERQMAKDYAARIVACVNACEGFTTASIEDCTRVMGGFAKVDSELVRMRKEHRILKAQRDELLAALVALVADCDTGERGPDGKQRGVAMPRKEPVWAAHAAIARAKGQQPTFTEVGGVCRCDTCGTLWEEGAAGGHTCKGGAA